MLPQLRVDPKSFFCHFTQKAHHSLFLASRSLPTSYKFPSVFILQTGPGSWTTLWSQTKLLISWGGSTRMQVLRGCGLTKHQRNNMPSNVPVVNLACMRSKLSFQKEPVLFVVKTPMALRYFCIICSQSCITHIGKCVEVVHENGVGCQMSHHWAHKYINKLGKEGIFQKNWIFCE